MDIKTRYILFCDYALISSDGKLSIIGEFDHLFSSGENAVLLKAFLVASLKGPKSQEIKLSLQLQHEETKEDIFRQEIAITSNNEGKVNILLGFENLKFEKFGAYKLKIFNGKDEIGVTELHIMKVKQPKPAVS